MADRPVVSQAAEDLYAGLEPYAKLDTEWHLLRWCEIVVQKTLAQIHGYVTDQADGTPGWAIIMDPDGAPPEVLPWLAQFVGVEVTDEMDEAAIRAAIKLPSGFARGTPAALVAAVKPSLTPPQTVLVDERYQDNAWRLRVRTLAVETPDPAATKAAAKSQKPIGIVLTYAAIVTWDWGDLQGEHATWGDVKAAHDTWLDARTQLP